MLLPACSKGLLLALFICNLAVNGVLSHFIYGVFQKASNVKVFNNALKNPIIHGKLVSSAKPKTLFDVIDTVDSLNKELNGDPGKERTVFTDFAGLKGAILQETIEAGSSHALGNNTTGSVQFNNDLSGANERISKHNQVIDKLLSFIDRINYPPKGISVVVDESYIGQVTLERILVKSIENNRKISSFQVIPDSNARKVLINLSNIDNRIIILDTSADKAAKFLTASREMGLSGFNGMYTWMFFRRAKNVLIHTCSRPGGDYLLFEHSQQKLTDDPDFILNKILPCQSNAVIRTKTNCTRNVTSPSEVKISKLWTGFNSSYWVTLQAHDMVFMSNYQIYHEENPLLPKVRVVIAGTYEPWIFVVDLNKTSFSDTLCGLSGRHGYRYASETSNITIPICAYGLAIDVMKTIEKKLEFNGEIHVSRDGLYGSYNESTGESNGIVAEIVNDRADLAMDLMEDSSRIKVVDFSTTLAVAGNAIAYVQESKYNSSVLGPFHTHVWITIFSCIAGFMLLVWLLEKISPDRKPTEGDSEDKPFDLPESMNYVWGIFFSGEIIDRKPQTFGNHIALIAFAFVSILILAAYSANLIAFFVVLDDKPLITGMYDEKLVGPNSKLSTGIIKATSIANFLQFNKDERLRNLYRRSATYASFHECFEALKLRQVDVIFGDTYSLRNKAAYDKNCSLKIIPIKASERSIGLVFQKGSTWKRRLNHAVMHMISSGKSDKLLKTWFSDKTCIKSLDYFQLGISEIVVLFYFLAVGIAGCVFIALVLAVWTMLVKWKRRKKETIHLQN